MSWTKKEIRICWPNKNWLKLFKDFIPDILIIGGIFLFAFNFFEHTVEKNPFSPFGFTKEVKD